MKIISLGAGVQSTTLLLMAAAGELGTLPDAAIFADTGWEPAAVYRHLDWLDAAVGQTIPIYRISKGNIRTDALQMAAGNGNRFASLPFHLRHPDTGKAGMIRRQCTNEYKLEPLRRQVRALMPAGRRPRPGQVEMLIGISADEAQRMKDSRVQYIRNLYPLIDRGMTRQNCLQWLSDRGHPTPPKSACIGCPFHGLPEWRAIKAVPEEWAEAVEFDEAMRNLPRIKGEVFLNRFLVPLAQLDLSTEAERGQPDLFGNECEGMCGV